jgi:putative peptide zinc metalloprotease protein
MSTSHLRRDLESIPVQGAIRPYRIVVDEVAGKFARVSEEVWQRLVRGDQDAEVWSQAQAAGMTRQRTLANGRKRFSFLAIRLPLGGIDWLARRLVRPSAVVFSVSAIAIWSIVIAVAFLIAISRSAELFASLGSLSQFLEQSNPLALGGVFVLTKVIHELGHAVMCRRMGSRCGGIGILLLCGMPCPYCDVTNIWRQSSAVRRAAVMLAGIYLELIIAALATFAWALSSDPALRWMALNLMVICGVSTLLFNANPLMRYDGYFVLSDFLGSTNLRQESQKAFRAVVTRRFAGKAYLSEKKSDRRSCLLAVYHLASKAYRVLITCTIATVIIGMADWLHLRTPAIAILTFFAAMIVAKNARRLTNALTGQSRWQKVDALRRWFAIGSLLVVCAGVFFVPLPRYRPASGMIDAASTLSVYLPEQQVIQQVAVDYGQRVSFGDPIVQLQKEQHFLATHRLTSQLRIARLKSDLARREALKSSKNSQPKTADHWQMLQATEEAVSAQLASARTQLAKTNVRAEASGVIIPAKPSIEHDENGAAVTLRDRLGMLGETRDAWCRISRDNSLHAALVIDAQDRPNIRVGSPVRITLTSQPDTVIQSTVSSVSEIKNDERVLVRSAAYQVLCTVPDCQSDQRLSMIGQECHGVFQLPYRSFAADFTDWLGGWIRG